MANYGSGFQWVLEGETRWTLHLAAQGHREEQLCRKEHLAGEQSEPQSRSDSLFEGHWAPCGTGHFPKLAPEQARGRWTCQLPALAVGSMFLGLKEHLARRAGR